MKFFRSYCLLALHCVDVIVALVVVYFTSKLSFTDSYSAGNRKQIALLKLKYLSRKNKRTFCKIMRGRLYAFSFSYAEGKQRIRFALQQGALFLAMT